MTFSESRRVPAAMVLRACLRPVVQALRALPPELAVSRRKAATPLAVFLPAASRADGAARLRIYNIASELERQGWACAVLPPRLTLVQRRRLIAWAAPDVLVMQGVRHALNRPALYPGQRILFDMDDADFHLPHLAGPVREAMPRVAAVIAGSAYVADWCRAAGAPRADVVITGAPVSARARPAQAGRAALVVWAQTRPETYVAEAAFVRAVMARVAAARPDVRFRLYDALNGDDPGFAESFRAAGIATERMPRSSYARYLASFDEAAVALAPLCPDRPFSRGKSVGKVLAYLDRGVPVVASDAGEHRRVFVPGTGVLSNDPDVWVAEILRLLGDAAARQAMADAAFGRFEAQFSLPVTAARVAGVLGDLAGCPPGYSAASGATPVGA